MWVLALLALGVVVAVIVTLWRMFRGGTVALVLGGIVISVWGVLRLVSDYQQGEELGVGLVMGVALAGGALALGSAFRLIARRRAQAGQ